VSPGRKRSKQKSFNPLLSLRKALRAFRWRADFERLQQIRGIGSGRRAFLVGSGPSLRRMDLSPLASEFVCVSNMGVKGIGSLFPHADMHVVTDTNRYRRYAAEIEAIAFAHRIPYRFLSRRVRRLWQSLPERANEPFYLVPSVAKLSDGGELPPMSEGVVRAPSVLLTGAVLLEYLGFSPIHVIGCDLDYESGGVYFYELDRLDLVHERDPKVVSRRPGIGEADALFGVLAAAFARRGHAILNAGVGGNLHSLPRVDFASLFATASQASG
jgi:hypothetical protein